MNRSYLFALLCILVGTAGFYQYGQIRQQNEINIQQQQQILSQQKQLNDREECTQAIVKVIETREREQLSRIPEGGPWQPETQKIWAENPFPKC